MAARFCGGRGRDAETRVLHERIAERTLSRLTRRWRACRMVMAN